MLVSFRAHLAAGFFNFISLIFTGISLFTCHWMDFHQKGYYGSAGSGLYNGKVGSTCAIWFGGSPSWLSTTLAFMIIAFALQIIMALYVLGTSVYRRFHDHILKVDSALLTLSFISLVIAIVVYGIDASDYFDARYGLFYTQYSFGWSYILACVSTFFALVATGPVGHALKKIRDCGDCECNGVW